MSKTHVHHHNATAEGAAVAVVVAIALLGIVLVAPGALIVFAVDRALGLSLDVAQLWTFATVMSVVLLGGLSALARSLSTGLGRYFVFALVIGALLLVARFGLHARWPADLVAAFTGHG